MPAFRPPVADFIPPTTPARGPDTRESSQSVRPAPGPGAGDNVGPPTVPALLALAGTDQEAFDRTVARYVRTGGDQDVFRDPAVIERVEGALNRLVPRYAHALSIARRRAEADPARRAEIAPLQAMNAALAAERRAIRPLAGHRRNLRIQAELRPGPAARAKDRLVKSRCTSCGAPLEPQFIRLRREEQARDAQREGA